MKAVLIAAVAALALSACAPTVVTQTEYVEVKVPMVVPCGVEIGNDPVYADSNEALASAADLFEAVKLLLAGREQRIARDAVKTSAIEGCRPPPSAPLRPG